MGELADEPVDDRLAEHFPAQHAVAVEDVWQPGDDFGDGLGVALDLILERLQAVAAPVT